MATVPVRARSGFRVGVFLLGGVWAAQDATNHAPDPRQCEGKRDRIGALVTMVRYGHVMCCFPLACVDRGAPVGDAALAGFEM